MPTRERPRVEDLLELPYAIALARVGEGWRARVEELDGCEATGATPQEAAGAVRAAMADWFGAALAEDRPVPPPRAAAKHSGRLLVRMPPALHAELARRAEGERMSMNALIVGILGGAVAPADEAGTAPAATAVPAPEPKDLSDRPDRTRLLSFALTANLVVVIVAAVVALGLLVLAWSGI